MSRTAGPARMRALRVAGAVGAGAMVLGMITVGAAVAADSGSGDRVSVASPTPKKSREAAPALAIKDPRKSREAAGLAVKDPRKSREAAPVLAVKDPRKSREAAPVLAAQDPRKSREAAPSAE